MSPPAMRPRFELLVPHAPEQVRERLVVFLRGEVCWQGKAARRHLDIYPCRDQLRFWSPSLSLELEECSDGSTIMRGRFGPHPNLWTFCVFLYAVAGFIATCGLMLGTSQWMLKTPPSALLLLPVAGLVAVAVYGGALVGQRLGSGQMQELRDFLRRALAASELPELDSSGEE